MCATVRCRPGPDGDGGALGQASAGALQACVDLTHLHGPFQTHHLQLLVWHVWGTRREIDSVK